MLQPVIAWIDRDVARWNGNPLATVIVSCIPMVVWSLITGDKPADAPSHLFALMLAPTVIFGSLGMWRAWRYVWAEHKRIQMLGAAEELQKKRGEAGDD